jgi:hypothetical protein
MNSRAADGDVIAICERGAGPKSLTLHLHTIGRSQVGNHETTSGIEDYGVMPADIVTLQDDVVVWKAPNSGGRRA